MPNSSNRPIELPVYIQPEALINLPKGVLFYPCSGRDYEVPIRLFADFVEDLWFCDIGYLKGHNLRNSEYNNNELDSVAIKKLRNEVIKRNNVNSNRPSATESSTLKSCYIELLNQFLPERKKVGTMIWQSQSSEFEFFRSRNRWVNPLILTDIYQHEKSYKLNRIHRRRGFAQNCIQKNDFEKVAIFFYRGDGCGEGGSGLRWLGQRCKNTDVLFSKMEAGALLATDNSNASYRWKEKTKLIEDIPLADQLGKEITFRNRHLKLVGNAGFRNGNTPVWQFQD